jgi:hypothetical protein
LKKPCRLAGLFLCIVGWSKRELTDCLAFALHVVQLGSSSQIWSQAHKNHASHNMLWKKPLKSASSTSASQLGWFPFQIKRKP